MVTNDPDDQSTRSTDKSNSSIRLGEIFAIDSFACVGWSATVQFIVGHITYRSRGDAMSGGAMNHKTARYLSRPNIFLVLNPLPIDWTQNQQRKIVVAAIGRCWFFVVLAVLKTTQFKSWSIGSTRSSQRKCVDLTLFTSRTVSPHSTTRPVQQYLLESETVVAVGETIRKIDVYILSAIRKLRHRVDTCRSHAVIVRKVLRKWTARIIRCRSMHCVNALFVVDYSTSMCECGRERMRDVRAHRFRRLYLKTFADSERTIN